MSHLTRPPGSVDREAAKPGMAYFAGTSARWDATCGQCRYRQRGRCRMFSKLMAGKKGEPIRSDYSACKYFEER